MGTAEDYEGKYQEMFGFMPTRVKQRMKLGDEVAPDLLKLVEEVRLAALHPAEIDPKATQLLVFGILLAQLSNGAGLHAIAAKRLGATKAELHAVAGLTYLYRGLSAFNLGVELIEDAFKEAK